MIRKYIVLCLYLSLLVCSAAYANSDAIVIPNGDIRIKGAGSGLVFPDGSVQYKAAVDGGVGSPGAIEVASVIVGTWNVNNYPAIAPYGSGQVSFFANGTYSVTSGAFRVAGNYINAPFTGTWRIVEGVLVELVTDVADTLAVVAGSTNDGTAFRNSGGASPTKYPQPILLTASKIVLKDGALVSVLTQAQ
jgi:hypothetical protein